MQVRIYRPTKTTMQSGNKPQKWLLEFTSPINSRFIEPFMGRSASKDMMHEVKLQFATKEAAINFAKAKNYNFEIIESKDHKIAKKSYASNFS